MIHFLGILNLIANLACRLEDQECEESEGTAEQQAENEDSEEPVCRIGGGRRPLEGFPATTSSVNRGILKCILTQIVLLLKYSTTLL